MKRSLIQFAVLLTMLFAMVTFANATDKIISTKVDSAITATDSRGGEYVRLIVTEKKTLQGVEYEAGIPLMAFSSNPEALAAAKLLKAGDSIKAIVSERQYQGRTSYTVIKFLDQK